MNISLYNFLKFSLRYNLVGCILGLGYEFGFNMLNSVKRFKANKKQIVPKIIEFLDLLNSNYLHTFAVSNILSKP